MERFTEKVNEPDLWKYRVLTNKNYRVGQHGNGKIEFCGKFINKLGEYEDAEENGLLLQFPCRVGQTVFVDARTLPLEKMEFEKETLIFETRVISIRINSKGMFIKVAVKAKFFEEWIDYETGPDGDYFEEIKYYTYPKSAFGKTIFSTMEEAEKALEERESKRGREVKHGQGTKGN